MEIITVDALTQECRDQADEQSEVSPTPAAMLRLMNRGLRIVNAVLARNYPDPLIRRADLGVTPGTTVYEFPVDCFEGRVECIEFAVPGAAPIPVWRRNYRDAACVATSGGVAVPWAWDIEDEHIRLLQTPTGEYSAEMKYVRKLDPYVLQQGRVTAIGDTYLLLDSVGTDLDDASDAEESYINVVSASTGTVRATYQIASIVGSRVNLRATPVRSVVGGRTVSSSDDFADGGAALGDYICLSTGTCVVQLRDTVAAYIVDYTSAALSRSHDDPGAQLEQTMLRDIEARVSTTAAGRTNTERVRIKSQAWSMPRRVWPTMRGT